MNCFGFSRVLTGQKRLPTPPAMIIKWLELFISVLNLYNLGKDSKRLVEKKEFNHFLCRVTFYALTYVLYIIRLNAIFLWKKCSYRVRTYIIFYITL